MNLLNALINILGIGLPAMAIGVLFVRMGDSYKKRVLLEEKEFDFLIAWTESCYIDNPDDKATFERIIEEHYKV